MRLIYADRIARREYVMADIAALGVNAETKRRIKRCRIRVGQAPRTAALRKTRRRGHEEALQAVMRMRENLDKVSIKRVVEHVSRAGRSDEVPLRCQSRASIDDEHELN